MNSYGFIGVFCRKGDRVFTRRAGKSNTEFVFTESAEEVRAAKNVPREEHPASRELNESFLVSEPECRPLKRQDSSSIR